MYITKGTNGFYIKVTNEYHGEKTEGYIQVSFKRGSEPLAKELNDYNSYEGHLYFEHKGKRREVFPGVYRKRDGSTGYKLIFMDEDITEEDIGETNRKQTENKPKSIDLGAEDLPFY